MSQVLLQLIREKPLQADPVCDVIMSTVSPPVCELTCAPLLQPQPLQDLSELLVLADVWQLDMDSGPQSRPQVGRTGEDIAQVFVPHELVTSFLKQALDLPEREGDRWSGDEQW